MTRKFLRLLFCAAAVHSVQTLHAQGTAFMYQGRLNDGGSPANGIYDLQFTVFDAVTNGNAVSGSLTNFSVPASNGLFGVTLDFGAGIFTGPDRWLDVAVRATGVTNFTELFPRQKLTPVPYAIFANSASNLVGSLGATQLVGTLPASAFAGFTNSVALTNGANLFSGTFSGNGTNLVNLNASQLTGGTVADARLSSNVALLNGNQTFSGANNFTNWGNSFSGSFFGNGLVGWIATNGTAIQAEIDHGYLLTNLQMVTVALPTNANAGDIVRISGAGAGGWQIAQSTNQSILGNFSSFSNSLWTLTGAAALNWYSIASSADGSHLAAVAGGTGGGVFNSTDSGTTWSGPNGGNSGSAWRSIASSADGTRLVAAIEGGGKGGIYTNSGTSWAATGAPGLSNWISVASSADASKLAAAIDGGGIYTSTNFGSTWTKQTSGLPGNSPWISIASSANGSNLVAAVDTGGVYTSSNSGTTWAQQTSGLPSNQSWESVASSADGSKLVAAINVGRIYASVNSGVTWTTNNAPSASWESIASSADGSKLAAVVAAGGIYLSSNGGSTWTQSNPTNGAVWSCIASSADGSKLAATVLGGGIYHSQASLQTSTTTGTNGYINGIQGSAVELQYIGNSRWMSVSSAGTIWAY